MSSPFFILIILLVSITCIHGKSFEWNSESNDEYCFTDAIHQSVFSLSQFQEIWFNRIEHAVENNVSGSVTDIFTDINNFDNSESNLIDENREFITQVLDTTNTLIHDVLSFINIENDEVLIHRDLPLLELVHSYLHDQETCSDGHFCRIYIGPDDEYFSDFTEHYELYVKQTQLISILTNFLNTHLNITGSSLMAAYTFTEAEISNWLGIAIKLYENFVFNGRNIATTSCYEFDSCTETYEELNVWEMLQFFEDMFTAYKSQYAEYQNELLFGNVFDDMNDKDLPAVIERIVFYALLGEFPENEVLIQQILNCMYSTNEQETPEFCHRRECQGNPDCGEAIKIRQAHTNMNILNKILFGDEKIHISYVFSKCIYIENNCFEVLVNGLQKAYTEPIELTEEFLPEGTLDLMQIFNPDVTSITVVLKEYLQNIHKQDILAFAADTPIPEEILEAIPENFFLAKEIELLLNLCFDYAKVLDSVSINIDCQTSTLNIPFNWDLEQNGLLDDGDIEEFLLQMLDHEQALIIKQEK